jgi:uncharacterized membrane protein
MRSKVSPAMIAVVALMIAITAVFTITIQVPVPATTGYVNFSDVAIYFAAFLFGPWVGFVAGGVGTALADLSLGYAQFAPLSFVAHGLEGLLAGYVVHRLFRQTARGSSPYRPVASALAWGLGTVAMLAGYFFGEALMFGWGPALVELPFNLLQNVVGGLVGIPLVLAVRRAYPPIAHIGYRREWTEGEEPE